MERALPFFVLAGVAACSPTTWRPLAITEAASDLEQVTRSSENELDPAISPDATAIAYEVAPTPDAPPRVQVMVLGGDVRYDSGDVAGIEPAWRPDGSGLVFLSVRPDASVLVETRFFETAPPLAAPSADVFFAGSWPTVSPDGSTLAMSVSNVDVFHTGWRRVRHFDRALGLADLGGARGLRAAGEGTEPTFSPDAKRLAFVRWSAGHAHVFVANADGSGAHVITDGPSDDEAPAWSPDGSRLVFCSSNAAVDARQADLFVVRPDGSGLRQLTEGDRLACHPTWGRDGRVYFHANAGANGAFHIWRLRPQGD